MRPTAPPHRDRRGRNTTAPPSSRSVRVRAQPHGRNEPPQLGHISSPSVSHSSTRAALVPTVNTAPPRATRPSRTHSVKRHREGLSYALIGTVPPPTNSTPSPAHTKIRRHPQCPETAPHVGFPSAAQHDVEPAPDLPVREALGELAEDLQLAGGELVERGARSIPTRLPRGGIGGGGRGERDAGPGGEIGDIVEERLGAEQPRDALCPAEDLRVAPERLACGCPKLCPRPLTCHFVTGCSPA